VNNQQVILVDEHDNDRGFMDKMEAHQKGLIHRAFSIFIFNSRGEMLLQQRALNKYHSAGLWSNSCCSHPYPGEEIKEAAMRRLREELGFETSLQKIFDFVYKASFENGLVENEFDHVFVGQHDGNIQVNPDEVNDYVFKPMEDIKLELKKTPEIYTPWFKISFPKIETWWQQHFADSGC
jgi:isopentenyl-diphosphate delta-isomerase